MRTDNPQPTTIAIGNSQLTSLQPPLPASGNPSRVSADSLHLTAQRLQFLLRVAPPALEGQRQHAIPACLTIAQAILESATSAGWGSSSLFRLANNPFGITYEHFGSRDSGFGAREWGLGVRDSGRETLTHLRQPQPTDSPIANSGFQIPNSAAPSQTREVRGQKSATSDFGPRTLDAELLTSDLGLRSSDPEAYGAFDAQAWELVNGLDKFVMGRFRRFPNLGEAFLAHTQLLKSPRYQPAFAVRDDWKQFAERLGPKTSLLDSEHCGYSTNPSYSAELIKLVDLYRLTDSRALRWYATGVDPYQASAESGKQ